MSVSQREYRHSETGKPAWGYDFVWHKERYREAGFPTREAASIAEQQAKKTLMVDHGRIKPMTTMRFEDMLAPFFEQRALMHARNTVEHERYRRPPLIRFFGQTRMDKIGKADIQSYMARRKADGMSNRTVNIELCLLRSLFDYAVDQGYAVANPAKQIRNMKQVTTDKWIPEDEQFLAMVEAAGKTRTGEQLATWLWLRAYTGMRPSESFFLEWRDVDFERDIVYVRPKAEQHLKTNKFRTVDLHPTLRERLLEWRKRWEVAFPEGRRPHDYMFFNPHMPVDRADGFRTAFRHAAKAAGMPKQFNSYTLRHYFISKCVMAGIDLLTIARWVGHSSTDMINKVYGHLRPKHTSEQMKKIAIGEEDDSRADS